MATYYVDASRPDNTGDGLTEETAKRTPRAASLAAPSGSEILLKRGYCYDPEGGHYFNLTGTSNIKIGTYGDASDKPCLDALTYQNPGSADWEYVSDGIWKKDFANHYVRRLWVGSTNYGILTSQRIIGTAKRRSTGSGMDSTTSNPTENDILATLDANNIWFGGGTGTSYMLYVYTGTALIDPPAYYEGLAFIQSDGSTVGALEGIHVENQTGIYAHDLHMRGNSATAIRLQAKNANVRDVSDCLFEDILVTHPYQGAFKSAISGTETSPLWRCKSSTVRRVYCDYSTSEDEQEPNVSYGYLSSVSDLFNIADGSVNIIVENCTAINSGHIGAVIGSVATAGVDPQGCKLLNNYIHYDTWHTYGRGLATYNGDANTVVSGNLVNQQNTRSQFAGSGKIIGNVWTNLRNSVRKPDVAEWIACESYVIDSGIGTISTARYIKIHPVDLLITNNTAYSPHDTAISFNFYNSDSVGGGGNLFPSSSVTVRNNIINAPVSKFLRTYEASGKVIGQQTLTNNCVHNGIAGDVKITWRGTDYTINAAPGCSGNIEIDPMLDANHRPQSPTCKRTGTYLGGKDFNGKHFYNPPNIGAVDDVTATPRYGLTQK